ncbi:MAG: LysR family transcriptional regulator [Schaedlerella sp.]|nr:LysR family transcriptional regulator [Schaedlerella sp.]
MDLQSLHIFIEVAEMNSFTKAGEKLGYSQPTISFQIKQLEKEMGVKLFDRIGHTVSLTDEGKDALTYAQNICRMSEEMVLGAKRRYEARGNVRIAMPDSLCVPLFGKKFSKFRETYPNVSLHVTTAGTDDLFVLLDHNEVDLVCTLDNHIYNNNYVIVDEEKINVHFIVSSKNSLASKETVGIEDLMSESFILTEKGMSYRRLLDENMARKSLQIHPVLEMANADLICRLVEQDMGISFLPDFVTEEAVEKNKVKRLHVEEFDVELWKQLFYRRDKWVSLQMKAIIEHLSSILIE